MRGHRTSGAGRARLGALRIAGIALLPLIACAEVFGLDDGGTNGAAGQASAGRSGGGRGGTLAAEHGGKAGMNPAAARAGSGGQPAKGGSSGESAAGTSGGGGEVGGAGVGGEVGGAGVDGGGQSGAGPTQEKIPGIERLGTECSTEGEEACSDESPFVVMRCKEGIWSSPRTCTQRQRCSPARRGCVGLDDFCVDWATEEPICVENEVVDCNPALYGERRLVCPYGCRDGACEPGGPTQLTLHTGQTPPGENWTQDIPICLLTADEDAGPRFALLREEAEQNYNRFFDIEFVGWGSCTEDSSGVLVEFVDACEGALVNDIVAGKPEDDAPVRISICRKYVDKQGETKKVDASLTRLLARHQLGHVLGLVDGEDPRRTVMVRGVERDHADELVLTRDDYLALDGPNRWKSPSSLVTGIGHCVSAGSVELGSAVSVEACETDPDDMAHQRWTQSGAGLQLYFQALCLDATGADGEGMSVTDCDVDAGSSQTFKLAHAQWRTPTHCVIPEDEPPVPGTKLISELCSQTGDASRAWFFEIMSVEVNSAYTARIHLSDSTLCVTDPGTNLAGPELIGLGTCDVSDDRQKFALKQKTGEVATLDLLECVQSPDPSGVLFRNNCTGNDAWFLSGALESDDGAALTLTDGQLSLTPLEAAPTPSQTFDLHF